MFQGINSFIHRKTIFHTLNYCTISESRLFKNTEVSLGNRYTINTTSISST